MRVGHRPRERAIEVRPLGGVPVAEVDVRERQPLQRLAAEIAQVERGVVRKPGREDGASVRRLRRRARADDDVERLLRDAERGLAGHLTPFAWLPQTVAAVRAYSARAAGKNGL